jgi:hypothetical protein
MELSMHVRIQMDAVGGPQVHPIKFSKESDHLQAM